MPLAKDTITYPLYYQRRKTLTVKINKLAIGGDHPLVLQSMLTSHTFHSTRCIEEMKQLISAGCQMIRLAIPARRDLAGMEEIRRLMQEEGIDVPLVADIHYAPHLAIDACEFFEKIRINPGNFSDRSKNSSSRSHQAFDFIEGRERFKERITPLIKILKQKKRALRIGVNQGSLSSRVLQKFGDSPKGMVESALEAVELFAEQDFKNIVVSLKSSNPLVIQKAYRLFCQSLPKDLALPLHLGVTEAGNDTSGRIKSIVGIAPLLFDGIGDTIRISLTEDSSQEIIFAKKFLANFKQYEAIKFNKKFYKANLETYRVQNTYLQLKDSNNSTTQLADASNVKVGKPENLSTEGYFDTDFYYQKKANKFFFTDIEKPLLKWNDNLENPKLQDYSAIIFDFKNPIRTIRYLYSLAKNFSLPVGLLLPAKNKNTDFSLEIQLACLLGEGILDFLLLDYETSKIQLKRLSYLLQATKTKISRTEFIACPSCGRTLFDLQDVTAKVKAKTNHLKGVKIGIMGCMVNGPGEMADADFGYVGSASGKVDLYLGHKKIYRGILEKDAVDSLIDLIKKEGKWKEAKI